jgi:signal transduction histidine kinase
MPLRLRLILSYSVLILALGLAAWAGVRTLTADLTTALGETAASVGRSVFTVLRHEEGRIARDPTAAGEPPSGGAAATTTHRELIMLRRPPLDGVGAPPADEVQMRVVVDGRELGPEEIQAHRLALPDRLGIELRTDTAGKEPKLWVSGDGFNRAIPLPRDGVDAALQRYTRQLGWGLLALLGLGLMLSIWLAQRVARPLRALADAAQAVGGGTLGAQVAADDRGVPEVRHTIAAFNRMSAQLQRLDHEAVALRADRELAELGEIGRGLAHSLRNPLHALGLSLEALAERAGHDADAQGLARSGREQLQRVDQALRGFLALSAGHGVEAGDIALREVIDDVLLEASQRAQGRVQFERGAIDARVVAVAPELRVMLHALVINALEASPDGGVVRVEATAVMHDEVSIDVADEGDGVDASVRARLFQPHVSSKPHGAGMGLFLAERLARLRYAGGIELLARLPRGTIARLHLHSRERRHG